MAERSIKPKHIRLKIAVAAVLLIVAMACGVLFYIWIDSNTPSYFEPGPVEIKVVPDKSFFSQGEDVNFTVTVINNQSWPIVQPSLEEVQIEKYGIVVEGSSLHIEYGVKVPTYPANSSTDFTWTWFPHRKDTQIIPHEIGTYTLMLHLKGNGYDASGHCSFTIR